MATFNKNNLSLVGTPLAGGPKTWHYWDTGVLVADVQEVNGFFSNGYSCGMRKGDQLFLTEGDTGLWLGAAESQLTGGRRQYGGTVRQAQDTGATQITIGLMVLIGDTS